MKYILIFFFLSLVQFLLAQTTKKADTAESLTQDLAIAKNDTSRVMILYKLSSLGGLGVGKLQLEYGQQGLALAERINFTKGRILCGIRVGYLTGQVLQKNEKAIELLLKTNVICEKVHDRYNQAQAFRYLGYFYGGRRGLPYYLKALKIGEELKIPEVENPINGLLAYWYKDNNILDSALYYNQKSSKSILPTNNHGYIIQNIKIYGQVYSKMGKYALSLDYFRRTLAYRKQYLSGVDAEVFAEMARVFKAQGLLDSAGYYADLSLVQGQKSNSARVIINAASTLFELNQTKNPAGALKYHLLATAARDTLYNLEKVRQIERLTYDEQNRQQQQLQEREKALQAQQLIALKQKSEIEKLKSEAEKKQLSEEVSRTELLNKVEKAQIQADANQQRLEQQTKISGLNQDIEQQKRTRLLLLGGLAMIALVAGGLFYNNRQKQRANLLLNQQKAEIDQQAQRLQIQKEELQTSLSQLKSTQNQLIQKEKLASLGELTAGIAHEIQNPLNFVNNFSEVSSELVEEMEEEIRKGNLEEVKAISGDLKQNLQKINHHGKRASSIVKGMLEHSRTSAGEKELTDINTLADEFLRLSYHGLRAKDNAFNSDFKLDLDPDLPKINIIPQEIGRVLLNLINNAFYAVSQSSRLSKEVIVTTKKLENTIEIRVKDNGNGIPKANLEKIFQPFFTTKPTGEGTGLGLSLSYDIITKGHGGSLEVVSEEGEGAEFIVKLPI